MKELEGGKPEGKGEGCYFERCRGIFGFSNVGYLEGESMCGVTCTETWVFTTLKESIEGL
eukprot:881106-Amorphochlora_amoeboformis.AAC.1